MRYFLVGYAAKKKVIVNDNTAETIDEHGMVGVGFSGFPKHRQVVEDIEKQTSCYNITVVSLSEISLEDIEVYVSDIKIERQ